MYKARCIYFIDRANKLKEYTGNVLSGKCFHSFAPELIWSL
jgi:hypothetical protein